MSRYYDPRRLAIAAYRDKLLWALENYSTLVVVGSSGSGKSTQLPVYLYEGGWASRSQCILVLCSGGLVAQEMAQRVGDAIMSREHVGWAADFQDAWDPDQTRIQFVSPSWLLRATLFDPRLARYSVIMVDELFQACSIDTEILLGVLKKLQAARRVKDKPSNLRLILAVSGNKNYQEIHSQVKALHDFFGRKKTQVCYLEGEQYSVDTFYSKMNLGSDYIQAAAQCALAVHRRESTPGNVLVFLPSKAEVNDCASCLNGYISSHEAANIDVVTLYAGLDSERKDQVFSSQDMTKNRRRIILTTSIAESKVIVPDVKYVVDTGMTKQSFFDANSGCELTGITIASKATARRRTARAGRDYPGGKCYRLYTEDAFSRFCPDNEPPATARSDLTWPLLRLKALGINNVLGFDLLHPAPAALLLCALDELRALEALDDEANLTPITGIHLATAPCEPRTAAFLIAALPANSQQSWITAAQAVAVAATLHTGKPGLRGGIPRYSSAKRQQVELTFRDDLAHLDGDHATAVNVLAAWPKPNEWAKARGIDVSAINSAFAVRPRLAHWLIRTGLSASLPSDSRWFHELLSPQDQNTTNWDSARLRRALVAGFFARAAHLAPDASYRAVKADRVLVLDPTSIYSDFGTPPQYICFCEYGLDDALHVRARHVARIDPKWLLERGDYYTLDKDIGLLSSATTNSGGPI